MDTDRRIEALERQVRALRRLAAGGLAVGLVVPLGAARNAVHERVEARSLAIVDEGGRERILPTTLDKGQPVLTFAGGDGKDRNMLGVTPAGTPSLMFNDKEENVRVSLGLMPTDEAPVFSAKDAGGKSRLRFGVYPKVGAAVQPLDGNGKITGRLP